MPWKKICAVSERQHLWQSDPLARGGPFSAVVPGGRSLSDNSRPPKLGNSGEDHDRSVKRLNQRQQLPHRLALLIELDP